MRAHGSIKRILTFSYVSSLPLVCKTFPLNSISSTKQTLFHRNHQQLYSKTTTIQQVVQANQKKWNYTITHIIHHSESTNTNILLPKFLREIKPCEFPSVNQARKACQFGRIIVSRVQDEEIRKSKYETNVDDQEIIRLLDTKNLITNNNEMISDRDKQILIQPNRVLFIATPETTVQQGDIICAQDRIKDSFYPTSFTGYIHPPNHGSIRRTVDKNTNNDDLVVLNDHNSENIQVIYEDNQIAIVNKPEYLTTIGEKRQDLQSYLPFLLSPPPPIRTFDLSSKNNKNKNLLFDIPRPVHRLDRLTSGIVLVSKTKNALSFLSKSFQAREIEKTYTAIVFGKPHYEQEEDNQQKWNMIDYPIDGKPSITLWSPICSIESPEFGTLTLLVCKPETGRYHQIRRHLSYCLGCPIVGDNKYDNGEKLRKEARSLGLFLCSNAIRFKVPYQPTASVDHDISEDLSEVFLQHDPLETQRSSVSSTKELTTNESTIIDVNIPLPDKFRHILGLSSYKSPE